MTSLLSDYVPRGARQIDMPNVHLQMHIYFTRNTLREQLKMGCGLPNIYAILGTASR